MPIFYVKTGSIRGSNYIKQLVIIID